MLCAMCVDPGQAEGPSSRNLVDVYNILAPLPKNVEPPGVRPRAPPPALVLDPLAGTTNSSKLAYFGSKNIPLVSS